MSPAPARWLGCASEVSLPDATCIDESCYGDALTYGRSYPVLALDDDQDPRTVRVRGDNGRTRWFPASCFDLTGRPVPRLETIAIRSDLAQADRMVIEVDLTFSDGQRRWCWFATPAALSNCGDCIDGTAVRIHCNIPHLIVVSAIDESIIHQALFYIERNGKLFASTRVF